MLGIRLGQGTGGPGGNALADLQISLRACLDIVADTLGDDRVLFQPKHDFSSGVGLSGVFFDQHAAAL